jgi:mannose-6-phosphate isomerase
MMLYPLTFQPIFKKRVWGGRKLEDLFQTPLPPQIPIGEYWEISDRPGDESLITNGPLAGKTLHWLVEHHSSELLGKAKAQNGRFPLLLKILDAREMLSLQVHPPAEMALKLGGEPKTELWYIVDAAPGSELFVGLNKGVTREKFEHSIDTGAVADCIYRQPVEADDAMFLPSGRVHAIGAGLVIFEIQQNSDTTYRAFDWNRVDIDGKPRCLHIAESLASIDFNDFEPALVSNRYERIGQLKSRRLVDHELFNAQLLHSDTTQSFVRPNGKLNIFGCTTGRLTIIS